MACYNRLLPPTTSLPKPVGNFKSRLPSLPHKRLHLKNRQRWQSGDLESKQDFKAALSKPQSRHLTPLKDVSTAKPSDPHVSFVPLSFADSNENLPVVPRYERKLPLCKKRSRTRQRVRTECEDRFNVLSVGVCPAERKIWVATGARRSHVKGALSSFGVQTNFPETDYDGSVITEPLRVNSIH